MAGTSPDFDAAGFRSAIKQTMRMGLPNDVTLRPTFRWLARPAYSVSDPAALPYAWDETVESPPHSVPAKPDVRPDCAVRFAAGGATRDTPLGEFDITKAELTILDEDYEHVKDADLVLLGGNTYLIDFVAPPQGLFDVTVWTIFLTARDES